VDAIKGLVQRYASQSDVVTSIQLVNEPFGFSLNMDLVKDFHFKGYYDAIRLEPPQRDTVMVFHDAFQGIEYWNGFMGPGSGQYHVMLDVHRYQIFSQGEVDLTPTGHIQTACAQGPPLRNADKWTIVGEWSGALTDCTKWLNGLGKGARYDGSLPGFRRVGSCDGKYAGTVAGLSADDKFNIRRYIEAQLDAYEQRTGWIFWTWKTESSPEWDMQELLQNGLFPQPLTNRQYPNQCGY
jgi:glucan 1,3-beta-glucosidase